MNLYIHHILWKFCSQCLFTFSRSLTPLIILSTSHLIPPNLISAEDFEFISEINLLRLSLVAMSIYFSSLLWQEAEQHLEPYKPRLLQVNVCPLPLLCPPSQIYFGEAAFQTVPSSWHHPTHRASPGRSGGRRQPRQAQHCVPSVAVEAWVQAAICNQS